MKSSLFVIVPVFNEEHHIESVIRQLCAFEEVNLLVVDDNSSDRTVDILQKNGVGWIKNKFTPGRDGSIKTGLIYYEASRLDDWVVIFDGDGQHCVSFVDYLRFQEAKKTIFKGDRFSSASPQINTPSDRVDLANQLRDYIKDQYGIQVNDLNCGLLGIPKYLVSWVLNCCEFDKHFSVELCVRAKVEKKIEVDLVEIPVPAIYNVSSPKHLYLYKTLSPAARFETRYMSIVGKINSLVESNNEII